MRIFLPYLTLITFLILSCQNSERLSLLEEESFDSNENSNMLAFSSPTSSQLLTQTSPPLTPGEFSQSTFLEHEAEEFEIEESDEPLGDLINSVANSTGDYRAYDVCNPQCFIYVEEITTGKVYKLTSPHLEGNRWFSGITWAGEVILEFTLVTQPNHGVQFTVDVENQELIDISPVQISVTSPQSPPASFATPQIAEVTRIVGEEARPMPTLPPFHMMDVAPIQPRPDFVQLVGPLEYSIVNSDFYHLTPEGVGGIRITGTVRNGFQSAICVRPFIRELIQQGDNFGELPILWDRMTLLVDGEQKERYGSSGLGLSVWLSEEDQETQWIEGEDYCWFSPLQSGIHEVAFQFRQTSGDIQEYKWLFAIVD